MWTNWHDFDRMFASMHLLQDRMNKLFGGYEDSRGLPAAWGFGEGGPRSNLFDAGDHLEMSMEMPGVLRDDISIKLQGNYLEVSGSRKSEAPESYAARRVERAGSTFTRSFTLSADIDSNKVEARLDNGILTLIMPKAEAARARMIAVK